MNLLKFAVPKGSLEGLTFSLLRQAGYKITGEGRSYNPKIDDSDIELKILRPQEIPTLVSEGAYDLGISGRDWVQETNAEILEIADLEYGNVKIVLAVPKIWKHVNTIENLIDQGKKQGELRIATEYLNLASQLFETNRKYQAYYGSATPLMITPWWRKGNNSKVKIILSFGATEAKPPRDADAIIDNTETGETLDRNNLKIINHLMDSTALLIANPSSVKVEKMREKILDVLTLLLGVVEAKKKIHIFANVQEQNLPVVLKLLPALKSPTVTPLGEKGWYSINTVLDRHLLVKLMPQLREYAQGIVVHEPRQILPYIDQKKLPF